MKKILTLVLTICLLLSAIPFTSLNVNAEVYNSFVYVIEDFLPNGGLVKT